MENLKIKKIKSREKYFKKIILKLKKLIKVSIDNKDVHNGLLYLSCLEKISFNFYYSYRDEDIENYIKKLSQLIFPAVTTYNPEDANIVLTDFLAWDYHGLTQQYLRAMMNLDLNILYIMIDRVIGRGQCTQIIKELSLYKKAKVIHIKKGNLEQQINALYNEICNFKPSRIFLHSYSIIDSIVLRAFAGPVTFRIDLADHNGWCGIDFTDYVIGFRKWGLVLCNTIKKIASKKLILLPYYPILNDINSYVGLPSITAGKVLIFSGGASYKIVDDNQTFFKIMHRIVLENDNALILFACRGDDSLLKRYIKENGLDNRIILIGYRKDLGKIMEHIDIYLNTCPIGGGLMVQYAAEKSIPILSIINNGTIEYHDFKKNGYTYKTEYDNIEELHHEANRLICDKEYRITIGKLIHQCSSKKEQFESLFSAVFYTEKGANFILDNDSHEYNFEEQRNNLNMRALENDIGILSASLFKAFNFKMFLFFPYKMILEGCFNWLFKRIDRFRKQFLLPPPPPPLIFNQGWIKLHSPSNQRRAA
jgi:hypothetical protein